MDSVRTWTSEASSARVHLVRSKNPGNPARAELNSRRSTVDTLLFQDDQVPDVARKMLARFGTAVEFSDHYPDGLVDLTDSEIANDDLEALNFYPGFAALHLVRTHGDTR